MRLSKAKYFTALDMKTSFCHIGMVDDNFCNTGWPIRLHEDAVWSGKFSLGIPTVRTWHF